MKIKEKPEDFIVKEKIKLPISEGPHAYFLLKKKQWNTKDAINELAHRLGIPAKRISYAGLKDRNAITEQYISIYHENQGVEGIKIRDIELKYLGNGQEKIHTGMLEGNEFEITIREADSEAKVITMMPNYFDKQRFGVNNTNADIGKMLVQKDFKRACELLNIEVKDKNYVGMLQTKEPLLNLYLHSYQSKIFNKILSKYITSKYKNVKKPCGYERLAFPEEEVEEIDVPLISFDYDPEGEIGDIAKDIMRQENLTPRDFIIRQFPKLLSQTEFRQGFVKISNLKIEKKDEKTYVLRFELPKGSYATTAIKALFKHNL